MSGESINPYSLESLYKVTKKKAAIEQLVKTYFIHLEKTIVELSADLTNADLAKLCHRIKGSSRNTGASAIAERFQNLEDRLKANKISAPLDGWLRDLRPLIEKTQQDFSQLLAKFN